MINAYTSNLNLNVPSTTAPKKVTTLPVGALEGNKGPLIPPGQEPFKPNSVIGADFSGAFSQLKREPTTTTPVLSTRPYIWKEAKRS